MSCVERMPWVASCSARRSGCEVDGTAATAFAPVLAVAGGGVHAGLGAAAGAGMRVWVSSLPLRSTTGLAAADDFRCCRKMARASRSTRDRTRSLCTAAAHERNACRVCRTAWSNLASPAAPTGFRSPAAASLVAVVLLLSHARSLAFASGASSDSLPQRIPAIASRVPASRAPAKDSQRSSQSRDILPGGSDTPLPATSI